jgi:3-hydroxyisobutyrate dehydrogenase
MEDEVMTAERIGIIGTGRMGTAMAKRLLGLGYGVSVWNRSAAGRTDAAEAGAIGADDLASLCDSSDILISSLTNYEALCDVHQGTAGLLAQDLTGKLYIEMSTLLPDEQIALAADVVAAGCGYVDCPVGGTVAPALNGALLGMAGGTPASWKRARPVMEDLCKRVEHLGPVGTGAAMKLAVNLPLAIYWATLGEAMTMLKTQGISNAAAVSLLSDSSAGPVVLKNRMELIVRTLDGTDQIGTFDVNGFHKDLSLALKWAAHLGTPMQVSGAAQKIYAQAIEKGLGGFDGSSLSRFVVSQ